MNVQPALPWENILFIDGLPVSLDVPPAMQNGRILVPFRAIAEALNVEVNWDGKTQKISAAAGEDRIELTIGSKTAYHNLTPILLDVGPQIIDGRTLIPLRFFGTALGCTVNWVENSREVQISSPPTKMYVTAFYALGDRGQAVGRTFLDCPTRSPQRKYRYCRNTVFGLHSSR